MIVIIHADKNVSLSLPCLGDLSPPGSAAIANPFICPCSMLMLTLRLLISICVGFCSLADE